MTDRKTPKPNLFAVLAPYKGVIGFLIVLTIAANGLSLAIPRLIAGGIDAYTAGNLVMGRLSTEFIAIAVLIFLLSYGQAALQAFAAERAARDIRNKMAEKISEFSYERLESETPSKLLTNLTSDIDAIKMFISNAVVAIISSLCLIIGSSAVLLYMNWRLALVVLCIIPLIGAVFSIVFKKMGPLFFKTQGIIDRLNASINESILGAALVRVFNSVRMEKEKFSVLNSEARDNGLKILRLFSMVIPIVGIIANVATVAILMLGGHFVISGSLTIGEFAAFQSYVFILIFPIIILGFMSSVVSRAQASYGRIWGTLSLPYEEEKGTADMAIKGDMDVKNVSVSYGEGAVLKDVSFSAKAGMRTAVIGPTAAGKTQLLYALIGLVRPDKGEVLYDGRPIGEYKRKTLHSSVAIVFQDSVMFNMSLRDNVAFSPKASDADITRAIDAAELGDLIKSLPKGLDTVVSERGTSLSGGQKQRVMLARALALNPKVLLLDDFTARVDASTEAKILANLAKSYPDLTIVSVTQKISSARLFDQTILLMEGEILAKGTHDELLASSPEYAQIAESQKSTQTYETTNELRS